MSWYESQVENRNFLSPIGFIFILEKAKKVSYLCQTASIPTMTVGSIDIPTGGFAALPIDGNAVYQQLDLQFIVDESMENYMQIHNWMRALGTPESFDARDLWKTEKNRGLADDPLVSAGTLQVLNNNNNSNFDVVFKNLFPISLSTLQFDVTAGDNEYFRATASFKYSSYQIRRSNSQKLL
tara:strand:+ start:202 stop:747 length:546 start_codon:yes stop_codon:yes gene_type:complete